MSSRLFTVRGLELVLCACGLTLLAGCPPTSPRGATRGAEAGDGSDGTYYAAANKLYDSDVNFDIRWTVTHQPPVESFDPSINIDNRQLTMARCDNCHNECGFDEAFDLANYGKPEWKPVFRGTDWARPVQRMIGKSNAFLNEQIAERIYSFLRDETTIGYDVAADPKGAVEVEVDEQGQPVRKDRAQVPQG